ERHRLLQLNLRYDNRSADAVLALIAETAPDVVTLNEVSSAWREALRATEDDYPYRVFCRPGALIGGVAILSRRRFDYRWPPQCHERGALAIAGVWLDETRSLKVAAVHLGWPWPYGQHGQVARLAAPLGTLGETALVAGDLNAAPWSETATRLAAAGGLTMVRGIGPTWLHRALPGALRPALGLPIDHVLVKGAVLPLAARRLAAAGSDHLPVLFDFALLPQERPAGPRLAGARPHMFW
ncbi:endonuclease/exonuclease/phosphatase family protein, partial [Aquibium sp. A9E412]|uniref:endonuclease/exonuclease/phosphatase family protein n=1 Tax=Aquibium sp. A9E412 TaxID=2976767 RepID=UPI0025B1CB01